MESEITHISSNYFDTNKFQKQIDIIKSASEEAQTKIDYYTAHDDDILYAVSIIEKFLKRAHRLCYGGQAINAYLPAKYKFYNPEYAIPDYDFFTASQYKDTVEIVNDLSRAGFSEVSVREGMHEGTVKIYVNFVPIADLTVIDSSLYRTLSKRETRIDGISYLDANTLRMLMYLELSRPRGEVKRWTKVFERLMLFNEFVPVKLCKPFHSQPHNKLMPEQIEYTLKYIIQNKRVFAGADLLPFYDNAFKTGTTKINWILYSNKPIIFFSDDSLNDANHLIAEFAKDSFTIKHYSSNGVDLLPSMKVIQHGKIPLIFIIDVTACHSYINIPIRKAHYGKVMRIASMDTLITLYFCFGLMNNKYFDIGSMECLANQLIQLSMKTRTKGDKTIFPFISLKCYGHQTTLPSLIRSKIERITLRRKLKISDKKYNRTIYKR